MAIAPAPIITPTSSNPVLCCSGHAGDAAALARAVLSRAPSGCAIDIGCGSGAVALPILRARPDISIVGIEVSGPASRIAACAARAAGVGGRLRVITGDAFDVPLPPAATVFANPPLLPGERGFWQGPPGQRALFWNGLVRRLAAQPEVAYVFLHLFDFHGIERPTGPHPSLRQVASAAGLSVEFVHRGVRTTAADSAIVRALPALRQTFPEGTVVVGDRALPLRSVSSTDGRPFLVPHTVALLWRPEAGRAECRLPAAAALDLDR